jgi:hypothetical protein
MKKNPGRSTDDQGSGNRVVSKEIGYHRQNTYQTDKKTKLTIIINNQKSK